MAPAPAQPAPRTWLRPALLVLLMLSIAWFSWRGPYRALTAGAADFLLFHSAARAWVAGSNPYLAEDVSRAWLAAGGDPATDPAITRPVSSLIYAPPMFVVLAPLAVLPQAPANVIWTLLNVGFVCFSLWALTRITGLAGNGRLGFWAAGFLCYPAATATVMGQLSLMILAVIAAAHLLRVRAMAPGGPDNRGTWASGALLGCAAIIKPQMGLLFLVYEAGRLRPRSVIAGLAALTILTAIGVGRLELASVEWFDPWRTHLHDFTAIGDGDPTRASPIRHHLINLAHPLHSFFDDRLLVRVLLYGILGGLSLAYFVIDFRRGRHAGEGHNELLSLSMTAAVTLLIAYHRTYDAVLLFFPLALAIRGLAAGRHAEPVLQPQQHRWPLRRDYALALLPLLPFVVPGSIVLHNAAVHWNMLPGWMTKTLLWDGLLLPHASWSLLLLTIWLVYLRARTGPAAAAADLQ